MKPSPHAAALPAVALLLFTLPGCTLAPVDQKPEASSPAGWSTKRDTTAEPIRKAPWTAFNDPALTRVVERALVNSPDLASAYARVRAARAAAGLADSGFWPTLSTGASATRSRSSGSSFNPAGGQTNNNYSAGATASYEVDLWGRVDNLAKAADAEHRSAHADLAAARHIAVTEIVRLWFDLRQARAERLTLDAELDARTRTYDLLAAREKAGLIGGDDVARAQLEAAKTKVDLDSISLRAVLLRNALVAAVGEAPGSEPLPDPDDALVVAMPTVPVAVPSALLKTRPDIVSADLRLDAALARQGAARANYYPNLTLSAAGGFSSVSSADLVDSNSRHWSIGPSVNLPLFTGGRNDAELEQSRARFDADWAAYRKTVLTAFRETEDALVTLERLAEREKLIAAVNESAADALRFARARYDKGVSSNLEVTLAERDTLLAKREAIKVRYDRLRATANLARTLGSGWNADTDIASSTEAFEQRLEAAEAAREKAKAEAKS